MGNSQGKISPNVPDPGSVLSYPPPTHTVTAITSSGADEGTGRPNPDFTHSTSTPSAQKSPSISFSATLSYISITPSLPTTGTLPSSPTTLSSSPTTLPSVSTNPIETASSTPSVLFNPPVPSTHSSSSSRTTSSLIGGIVAGALISLISCAVWILRSRRQRRSKERRSSSDGLTSDIMLAEVGTRDPESGQVRSNGGPETSNAFFTGSPRRQKETVDILAQVTIARPTIHLDATAPTRPPSRHSVESASDVDITSTATGEFPPAYSELSSLRRSSSRRIRQP